MRIANPEPAPLKFLAGLGLSIRLDTVGCAGPDGTSSVDARDCSSFILGAAGVVSHKVGGPSLSGLPFEPDDLTTTAVSDTLFPANPFAYYSI